MDHHARMSASRRVSASGGSVGVRSCTATSIPMSDGCVHCHATSAHDDIFASLIISFYTRHCLVMAWIDSMRARFMLEHMAKLIKFIKYISSKICGWFWLQTWGCFKLLHGSSVGHPKVVNLQSHLPWFWLEELRMCSKKMVYSLCQGHSQGHTPFQREVIDTTARIFFHDFDPPTPAVGGFARKHVFRFINSGATVWLQGFLHVEFINSSLRTKLLSSYFSSYFLYSSIPRDYWLLSFGSLGWRLQAKNFGQSWADGLVSAPSLSAVGVVTSRWDIRFKSDGFWSHNFLEAKLDGDYWNQLFVSWNVNPLVLNVEGKGRFRQQALWAESFPGRLKILTDAKFAEAMEMTLAR